MTTLKTAFRQLSVQHAVHPDHVDMLIRHFGVVFPVNVDNSSHAVEWLIDALPFESVADMLVDWLPPVARAEPLVALLRIAARGERIDLAAVRIIQDEAQDWAALAKEQEIWADHHDARAIHSAATAVLLVKESPERGAEAAACFRSALFHGHVRGTHEQKMDAVDCAVQELTQRLAKFLALYVTRGACA